MPQRHQRANHAPERGDGVTDGNAGTHRRTVLETGDIAQPAHGFANGAKSGLVLLRAGLTKAGQPHHHQPRVECMQGIPAQPELFQRAWAKVLDQDVGIAEQLFEHIDGVGIFQVEGQRLLVAGLHKPPQ